jgi:hypothetical protein
MNNRPASVSEKQTTPTPTPPDRWTPRIGLIALGLVALLCIGVLFFLSGRPEAPGTATPPAAEADGTQPTATGPVAVEVANNTGALGLLGQIVGVLGTVAAAAIGGIAGFLTAARTSGTPEPLPGTGEQQPLGGAG